MITTFNDAVELVLQHEGGYSNDPDDPGGETKFGISKRSFPDLDIANLTRTEAKLIYKANYWEKSGCDQLPEGVRYIHFDTAVNMGRKTAAKMLQRAAVVADDGIIGPVTLKAAQNVTIEAYALQRMYYYMSIIRKNKTLAKYAGGWSGRVQDVVNLSK